MATSTQERSELAEQVEQLSLMIFKGRVNAGTYWKTRQLRAIQKKALELINQYQTVTLQQARDRKLLSLLMELHLLALGGTHLEEVMSGGMLLGAQQMAFSQMLICCEQADA